MAEFDEKLNALLSDPNSMAQIMQLAQSLSGGTTQPPPAAPASRRLPPLPRERTCSPPWPAVWTPSC